MNIRKVLILASYVAVAAVFCLIGYGHGRFNSPLPVGDYRITSIVTEDIAIGCHRCQTTYYLEDTRPEPARGPNIKITKWQLFRGMLRGG